MIDRKLAFLTEFLNIRKEKGLPAALLAMQQANSREHMAEILNLLAVIENDERTALNERERVAQLGAESTNRIILFGSLLGFAVAAFIGIVTHLSITRPLSEFQRLMTLVGEGDLTQKSAREGGDELGILRSRPESDGDAVAEHGHADARRHRKSQLRDDGYSGFRQGTVRRHRRASGSLPGDQCHHAAGEPVRPSDRRKSQAGDRHRGGRFHRQYFRSGCGPEGQPDRGSDSRASRGGGPEHCVVERKDPDGGRHSRHGERYRGTIAPAGFERRD